MNDSIILTSIFQEKGDRSHPHVTLTRVKMTLNHLKIELRYQQRWGKN